MHAYERGRLIIVLTNVQKLKLQTAPQAKYYLIAFSLNGNTGFRHNRCLIGLLPSRETMGCALLQNNVCGDYVVLSLNGNLSCS